MLFHAFEFVLVFLPVTFGLFLALERSGNTRFTVHLLTVASLVFYGWWDWRFLALLVGSVVVNYGLGAAIAANHGNLRARAALWTGIVFDLGLIGVFKYADFAIGSFTTIAGREYHPIGIVLPLGISFFTFQQIAWIVDIHAHKERQVPPFLDFALFITFFPQLIAGPIVHWSEVGDQYRRMASRRRGGDRAWVDVAVGLSIFAVGVAKKIVIADGCAQIASPIFEGADGGQMAPTLAAWGAVLAYTLQIYFDFSGYSDMAIGLARLFGIRLPVNFYSPYKQSSIIGFWRSWHITLSRFLRDYVYIPLGGNRHGVGRRYVNMLATMLIGGLWHGASWNFVIWGGLHGAFLSVNHLWREFRARRGIAASGLTGNLWQWGGWLLTLACVMHAWILFRAETFGGAGTILRAMYAFAFDISGERRLAARITDIEWATIGVALAIAVLSPNTAEIFRKYNPAVGLAALQRRLSDEPFVRMYYLPRSWRIPPWRPNLGWGLAIAALLIAYVYTASRYEAYVEFIYFRF
jgi:alginate O-acetyltransferase complex protein AlgI